MITLPPAVEYALARLWQTGYSAHLVGGCVRDMLLGRQPHDFDIATAATPEEVTQTFAGERVLPTGLPHGTVTLIREGSPIEITTYRVDGPYSDNRRPDGVTFTRNIREDLSRRDFTINAMALTPEGDLIDPFGGYRHLRERTVACVGSADARFLEDGLRVLRALRFAAQLQFTLAPETASAVRKHKLLLNGISRERVLGELSRLLCGPGAEGVLLEYAEVLGVLLPPLLEMRGFDQRNRHHIYDVLTHTAKVVGYVPPTPVLRFSALLHDTGKPASFTLDHKGVGHFYGHPQKSTRIAKGFLAALMAPNDLQNRVTLLITEHDNHLKPEKPQVLRALHRMGETALRELLHLQKADVMAQNPIYQDRLLTLEQVSRLADELVRENSCFTLANLAANGVDMQLAGLTGPPVGVALQWLLGKVMAGELPNEKQALLTALRERAAEIFPNQ